MRKVIPPILLVLLLLLLAGGAAVAAGTADQPLPFLFHTEWAKLSAVDGKKLDPPVDRNSSVAVVWLIPSPGYYSYAHDPGDEGIPLTITVMDDPESAAPCAAQTHYIAGSESPIPTGGTSLRHEAPVPVFLVFREVPAQATTLDISLLACSDRHCLPIHTRLLLPPPPPELPNAADLPWFASLLESRADTRQAIPREVPKVAEVSVPAQSGPLGELLPDAHTSVFRKNSQQPASASVPVPAAVLPKKGPGRYTLAPQELAGAFQIRGWARAVGLGLIAGLLLNFMPCVLPVLTMKFTVLLDADDTPEARKKSFREHNIWFAAGIITWFAFLSALSGVTGILWGQLFQSSEVIFFMLLVVFLMGLSMFDVFHLPVLDLQPSHSSSPRMQAFSTGVFTTLLATPCSGPLLGGVLAWAITKPLPVLMSVFAGTGIGMALPYAVIACFPRLVQFMPRPGPWLNVLERILGLTLMGTSIYLFSLLPPALHVKTLISLLVAASAAWTWGRWGSLRGSITRRMFLGAFSFAATALCAFWAFLPAQQENVPWIEFSESSFRKDLGEKPMLVEFTADWCPTCKLLERTALSAPNLLPILEQYDLTPVRVDMTFRNDSRQELLKALDSVSIPLIAVFPAGEKCSSPVILRDIYTITDIHLALRQAGVPHKRMIEMLNPARLLSQPRE